MHFIRKTNNFIETVIQQVCNTLYIQLESTVTNTPGGQKVVIKKTVNAAVLQHMDMKKVIINSLSLKLAFMLLSHMR